MQVSLLYQDWYSGELGWPPSSSSLSPTVVKSGSFLCFRKFRPFHHQFKSFPEINFLGPKDASPFEALTTPGSSHHTRWVFLAYEYQGLVIGQNPSPQGPAAQIWDWPCVSSLGSLFWELSPEKRDTRNVHPFYLVLLSIPTEESDLCPEGSRLVSETHI